MSESLIICGCGSGTVGRETFLAEGIALQPARELVPRRRRERPLGPLEGGEAEPALKRLPSEGPLHPDVGARIVVVAGDLREAVGTVETHRRFELGLRVQTQPPAAEALGLVEADAEQAPPQPLALEDRPAPHALEL